MATTPTSYMDGNYSIRNLGGGRFRVQYMVGANNADTPLITFGVATSLFTIDPNDISTTSEPLVIKRLISDDTGNRPSYSLSTDVLTFSLPTTYETYTSSQLATSPDGVQYRKYIGYSRNTLAETGTDFWQYVNAWSMKALGGQRIPNTIDNPDIKTTEGALKYVSLFSLTHYEKGLFFLYGLNFFGAVELVYNVYAGSHDDGLFIATINQKISECIATNALKKYDGSEVKAVELSVESMDISNNKYSIMVRFENGRCAKGTIEKISDYTYTCSDFALMSNTRVIRIAGGVPVSAASVFGVGDNGVVAYGSASAVVGSETKAKSAQVIFSYGGLNVFVASTGSGSTGGGDRRNKLTQVKSGWSCTRNDSFIAQLSNKINGVGFMDNTSANFQSSRVNASAILSTSGGKMTTPISSFCKMNDMDSGAQTSIKALAATPLVPITEKQRWLHTRSNDGAFTDKIVISDVFRITNRSCYGYNGWGLIYEQYSQNGEAARIPNETDSFPIHSEAPISLPSISDCQCTSPDRGCITYDYTPATR